MRPALPKLLDKSAVSIYSYSVKKIVFGVFLFMLPLSINPDCSFAMQNDVAYETFDELELTAGEKKAMREFNQPSEGEKSAGDTSQVYKIRVLSSDLKKPVNKSKLYLSGGYVRNDLHYKEITKSTDHILDEDYGNLDGFYAVAGYKSGHEVQWMHGNPFIEGYFQKYSELISYSSGSLSFDDEYAKIYRFGAKIGAYKEFSKKGEVFGYLDIGRRTWQRGQNRIIQSTRDYAEKYWWTYFGIGTGFSYEFFPRFTAGIEAEAMYSPESLTWMRADLYEGGTFDLGMVLGAEVKFPFRFYLLKNLSVDFIPYLTYWEINESTNTTISGTEYYEPYSRTRIEGIHTGLTYRF